MSLSHLSNFYVPWAAALAVAAEEPLVIGAATVVHFQGLELPLVQSVLAIAGVLMARPLARKKEAALPLSHFLIVSIVMVVVALAFVAETRPGVLFTFVVSLGLGFSGYSLIETAGEQIAEFIKRVVSQAADAISFKGTLK